MSAHLAHEGEGQHSVGISLGDEQDVNIIVAKVHEGDRAQHPDRCKC